MSKRRFLRSIPPDSKIVRSGGHQTRHDTRSQRSAIAPVARERQQRQAFLEIARCQREDEALLGFGGLAVFGWRVGFERRGFGVVVGGGCEWESEACCEGGGVGEAGEAEDGYFGGADEDGEAFGWRGEVCEEVAVG